MSNPINPSFLGKPDSINLDFNNLVEGPHTDVIHRLSATDTLKTRMGLRGEIISQELLQNEITPSPPADPSGLSFLG